VILYIYYIKEKYEFIYGEILPIVNNIFAYTTSKKKARLFEKQRNMKLFKKEKKKISIIEYKEFLRELNSIKDDRYIEICKYDMYMRGKYVNKKVAVTNVEKNRIYGRKMVMEVELTKYCWVPGNIYKNKIYKALEILKYNDISRYIGSYPDDSEEKDIEDIIKVNELEILIDVIGRTLG
jgi:hypothetical protein